LADTAANDPRIQGVLKLPFAQQLAFFRAKLGNLVPTAIWTDMMRSAHDTGFMVAGAQSADLLQGLAVAVDRAVAGGSLDAFRKDFQALVERTGWSYKGEFNWRTRTIYSTNIATSYNAGRLAQLRDGGFPFYMYKHGGSADPRPLHLSWDGIVLPAGHVWWQTHFTPNGWGCTCRVIGLRRPEDARRYGGDPNKPLPVGWDQIDPKTGVMIGIDKGFDYQPGATVSDAVTTMAEKTRHWEYALAKAYMQGLPDGVRDSLAIAYRGLPSFATDVRLYAQRILEGRAGLDVPPVQSLGLVTEKLAANIRAMADAAAKSGLSPTQVKSLEAVTGRFDFSFDVSAVMDTNTQHGNARTELTRGQRAIDPSDYAMLLQVLSAPDSVDFAGAGAITAQPLVRFVKRFKNNEEVQAVFEPRKGRKTMALVTFFVRRAKKS